MPDEIEITFHCKECGGTVLSLSDGEADHSIASCKACGQPFGTWGEVKAKARQAAVDDLQSRLRDTFKGLKGWKVE